MQALWRQLKYASQALEKSWHQRLARVGATANSAEEILCSAVPHRQLGEAAIT